MEKERLAGKKEMKKAGAGRGGKRGGTLYNKQKLQRPAHPVLAGSGKKELEKEKKSSWQGSAIS